ncbi:MAG: lysine-2,3-aminomutase-like protein [Woeseiaceae bacterium]|nr:lysine-2,3-aminomutase-like protein [Woeseiaceae bacterium]
MPRRTLRNSRQLENAGLIKESQVEDIRRVAERYSVALTPGIASLIDTTDSDDPIKMQFVPDVRELSTLESELDDPIGDAKNSPVKGVVHRYPDRALLIPTHVCSVYCRYCFRREFVGSNGDDALTSEELADCFRYLRKHPEIWEVILTGGDPLVLSARRLSTIARELSSIEHIGVVRIHTRVPAAAPDRISTSLVDALRATKQALFVILHINHHRELTSEARAACARLIDAGIPILSQTVLLKKVNDNAEELGKLMRLLVENRIKPYYLHHCDLAPGTHHFRTSVAAGQRIMRELRGRYSGLCQPTYVLDIPGGAGKSPIGPSYLAELTKGNSDDIRYVVEDYLGEQHEYQCIDRADEE